MKYRLTSSQGVQVIPSLEAVVTELPGCELQVALQGFAGGLRQSPEYQKCLSTAQLGIHFMDNRGSLTLKV